MMLLRKSKSLTRWVLAGNDKKTGLEGPACFVLEQVFDDFVVVLHSFQVSFRSTLCHSVVWRPVVPVVQTDMTDTGIFQELKIGS